jgi:hypothetical protein
MEPAGQDLGAPLAPEIKGSLARDRFDSDCVLGTQFESQEATLKAPQRGETLAVPAGRAGRSS